MVVLDCCAHDRTLRGAIDSYMKALVRVRPQIAAEYGECLEDLADRWLDDFLPNALDALTPAWLRAYVALAARPAQTEAALRDFFRWAVREQLLQHNPLER